MRLAPLFRYPQPSPSGRRCPEGADEGSPHPVPLRGTALSPGRGLEFLEAFSREMATLDLEEQQATYTSTFDLAPSCTPYLGIHLFGDENPDRARLMVGLKLAYKRVGIDAGTELPDHVAEVLAFAERDDVEERDELVQFVLKPALTKMNEILSPTTNPYRNLVAAALHHVAGGPS